MSQQPPPLPIQDEQHSLFTEPPPLPFMQPPSWPAQDVASPIPASAKEGRLNPNVTFLLGIWAGIGLCAVAFCFLAISGRFEPVVRWVQRTAKDLESPDSTEPSNQTASATTDEKPDDTPSDPNTAEPAKPQKSNPSSKEFREGFATGEEFGRKLGSTAYAQGRRVGDGELRGVLDGVRQFDNPYPGGSSKADDWLIGWEEGARAGLGKNLMKE